MWPQKASQKDGQYVVWLVRDLDNVFGLRTACQAFQRFTDSVVRGLDFVIINTLIQVIVVILILDAMAAKVILPSHSLLYRSKLRAKSNKPTTKCALR